jgi:hypothetical protein
MSWWSGRVCDEICTRAAEYAKHAGVESYRSRGTSGVTLFPTAADQSSHGNFRSESFAAIQRNPSWRRRLDKPHTKRAKALPP